MTTATKTPTFPLPEDQIPSVQLINIQAKEYRHITQEIVTKTLYHETKFRYQDNEILDEGWKFVRSKERMRVYKRTAPSSSSSSTKPDQQLSPMVLAAGCMEGELEDVLYGLHHKTTEEMRSVTSFLNKNHKDAAVLANIDLDTETRRLHARAPGYRRRRARQQVRLPLHEVRGLPGFPEFSNDAVVRAQVMLCSIYRQITPTLVGVYAKGIFDLSGDMMDFLSYLTAAELVLGISKALECAAAKRLTLLVLHQPELDLSTLMRRSPRVLSSSELAAATAAGSASNSEGKNACSVCHKKRFFLGPPNRTCMVCTEAVCTKCYVKAVVFAKPQNLKVVCCKACVIESRELQVDPRQPLLETTGSDPTSYRCTDINYGAEAYESAAPQVLSRPDGKSKSQPMHYVLL